MVAVSVQPNLLLVNSLTQMALGGLAAASLFGCGNGCGDDVTVSIDRPPLPSVARRQTGSKQSQVELQTRLTELDIAAESGYYRNVIDWYVLLCGLLIFFFFFQGCCQGSCCHVLVSCDL